MKQAMRKPFLITNNNNYNTYAIITITIHMQLKSNIDKFKIHVSWGAVHETSNEEAISYNQ